MSWTDSVEGAAEGKRGCASRKWWLPWGRGPGRTRYLGTAPMEPRPGPEGPEPETEPEGAGGPRAACPFLAWSAAEVAEWVVQLGFPQYEVRGCRPGRSLNRGP